MLLSRLPETLRDIATNGHRRRLSTNVFECGAVQRSKAISIFGRTYRRDTTRTADAIPQSEIRTWAPRYLGAIRCSCFPPATWRDGPCNLAAPRSNPSLDTGKYRLILGVQFLRLRFGPPIRPGLTIGERHVGHRIVPYRKNAASDKYDHPKLHSVFSPCGGESVQIIARPMISGMRGTTAFPSSLSRSTLSGTP